MSRATQRIRLSDLLRPGVTTVLAGRTTKAIEFAPDGAGGGTCANPVSAPIEPVSTTWLITDVFDRIITSEEALDSGVPNERATTQYEYGQGRLEKVTRLAQDKNAQNYDRFLYKRNVAGVVTRLDHLSYAPSLVAGRKVSYVHDQLGRVISTSSNDAASDQVSQSMTYSGSGEVLSLSSVVGDLVDPRSYNYDYDHRHQLLLAEDDQGFEAAYTYTRTGLLESAWVVAPVTPGAVVYPRDVTYRYPSEGAAIDGITDPETVAALSTVGTDPSDPNYTAYFYSYDAAGNMTSRTLDAANGPEVVQTRYDGMHRLRRRTAAGESETYQYFGPQRWLATEDPTPNSSTRKGRIWLGASEIIFNCTASVCTEETKRTTISFGGQSVARIDQDAQGVRDPKLLHASGHGHLLAVYTYERPPAGGIDYTLASAFQYGPFGEILESASAPNISTDDFLQRFNGKEYDTASGLSYYGYRYYDPIAQIWTRPDPKYRDSPEAPGADRRGNLYTFSLNNPVRYVDPDGLDTTEARRDLDNVARKVRG